MNSRIFILSIFLLTFCSARAQQSNIENIRNQYFSIDKTGNGALNLFKTLGKTDLTKDPVLLAYYGATSAASAGSVSGVRTKLEYFNRGKDNLEKAVTLKPLDAEIRFLRLATQLNAPGFLGYTGNIKSDKSIIFTTLNSVAADHPNAYLYHRICVFLLSNGELNANEKKTANQLINKFTPKK